MLGFFYLDGLQAFKERSPALQKKIFSSANDGIEVAYSKVQTLPIMKALVLMLLLASSSAALAYDSGIAVLTDKSTPMRVYINGKLISKQTGHYIRTRSTPGLFHLEVKVLNPWTQQWYVVKKDVQVNKGFEFQYKIVFINRTWPELKEIKRYPVYSNYYLYPNLYNRHPVS